MEKTIFEKIIDGEIPSYKIYEDEYVYSFLDVFPITKGHTLVIPKKHSRNILDCDPETAANIGRVLPKIANAVKAAYNCDGINIFQNNLTEKPSDKNPTVFNMKANKSRLI